MDEPLGIMALIGVFGLVIGAVWAVGKLVDIAFEIYCKMRRDE